MSRPNNITTLASQLLVEFDDTAKDVRQVKAHALTNQEQADAETMLQALASFKMVLEMALGAHERFSVVEETLTVNLKP